MALMYNDYKSGKNNNEKENAKSENPERMEQIKQEQIELWNKLEDIEHRLAKMEFIVTGADGENGLRSNQKKMLAELEMIKKIIWIGIGAMLLVKFALPILMK